MTVAGPPRDSRPADRTKGGRQCLKIPASKQLPDYVVEYLASLGTTPEYLAQHYPHTYDAFATISGDEIKALDTLGAALALDDPKGDNHKAPMRWKTPTRRKTPAKS